METSVYLSIIIPVKNEAENIKPLTNQLRQTLKRFKSHEVIWVDDGSTDGTNQLLGQLIKDSKSHRLLTFRRNFGQTAALAAGFDHSRGEIIVTLDGDLQNDPADIPRLIEQLDQGYDLVSGWRKQRFDEPVRVWLSQVANHLIALISGVNLHDFGCSLKAYRADLVDELRLYGEMHRFIPAIAARIGAEITEIEVSHRPRQHGASKYGLSRTFRVVLDVLMVKFLLDFQTRPLHLFGGIGLGLLMIGGSVFGYLVYLRLFSSQPLADRPLFLISIMVILMAIQFIVFGILAEMLVRIYYESQNKKTYYLRTDGKDD